MKLSMLLIGIIFIISAYTSIFTFSTNLEFGCDYIIGKTFKSVELLMTGDEHPDGTFNKGYWRVKFYPDGERLDYTWTDFTETRQYNCEDNGILENDIVVGYLEGTSKSLFYHGHEYLEAKK